MINGIGYGIPLTTKIEQASHVGILRSALEPGHGLQLRYMMPVPPRALQPSQPLDPSVAAELHYYEGIRKYIEAEAELLHRLQTEGKLDRLWQQLSCDFNELESVYGFWTPGFDSGLFLYPKEEEQDMPVSRNGKAYYTKEQYEQAKYNSSALEYAQSRGYELVRQGAYYTMKEHDSMVFTPRGTWFWNSRGINGGALEFQMYYEGKTLTEAVLTLAGEQELVQSRPANREAPKAAAPQPLERKSQPVTGPFRLPARSLNFKQLYRYLCGERGLDKRVVQELIRQGSLYQNDFKTTGGKTLCNATFVYKDYQGQPVGAYQRGMMNLPGMDAYKRDVPGSDKRFGWLMAAPEAPATRVAVFEGSIDAASDASLTAMKDGDAWRKEPVDRLSLEGLSLQPLLNYLQAHPQVKDVELMLDADEPGRAAAQRFAGELQSRGYRVTDRVPPFGKDWNEVLQDTRSMEAEQQDFQSTEQEFD